MNGVELAITIQKIHPTAKILLFSGQAGISEILLNGQQRGLKFELIAKPIHPLKLIEILKDQEYNLADQLSRPFHHRENEDGTVNSICPVCYRTVASRRRELQLAEIEQSHVAECRYMLPAYALRLSAYCLSCWPGPVVKTRGSFTRMKFIRREANANVLYSESYLNRRLPNEIAVSVRG